MKRYLKIWVKFTIISFQAVLANRFGSSIFLLGKLLRFTFFISFLILLVANTKSLAGYNVDQIVFFYLSFSLIDALAQLFFRGAYQFRPLIINGTFDFILAKPIHPLFRSLAANTDLLDTITLFPYITFLIISASRLHSGITITSVLIYILLMANAFAIAFALHVFIISLGIMTTEIDNTLWIYRDVISLGKVPVDVYQSTIRLLLTFVLPVAIMTTIPAKALLGILSPQLILMSVLFSVVIVWLALWFWRYALRRYASASS